MFFLSTHHDVRVYVYVALVMVHTHFVSGLFSCYRVQNQVAVGDVYLFSFHDD